MKQKKCHIGLLDLFMSIVRKNGGRHWEQYVVHASYNAVAITTRICEKCAGEINAVKVSFITASRCGNQLTKALFIHFSCPDPNDICFFPGIRRLSHDIASSNCVSERAKIR